MGFSTWHWLKKDIKMKFIATACLIAGQTNQTSCLLDNDEPSPISHGKELSEVSLGNLDKFTLVSPLLIPPGASSFENFSLKESKPFDHKPIASLLKTCESTSSEEDQCVSEPIPLPVKCNLVPM